VKPRDLLTQLSMGRIAIGAVLMARPELVTGPWLGKDGRRPAVQMLGRAFGARDAVLGAGTLAAMRGGGGAALRPWLLGGLAADAVDLTATHLARHDLPRHAAPLIYALAGGALVAGAANLASGDDSAPVT
jgi:hypothetical protein